KYNPDSGNYELHFSESTSQTQSSVTDLESGGYRVTITQGETTEIYRSWVFNQDLAAEAEITAVDCESFMLQGSFTNPAMNYYDPSTNAPLEVFQDIRVEWKQDQTIVGSTLEQMVFNPPPADTEYSLRVYDRFGCEATNTVVYESIVPEALFTAEPLNGEAPLTVNFNNQSQNADPGNYQWFFYRDIDEIKRESESTGQPVDSIMIIAYDDNPVYTYENSGLYKVKLVAVKTTGTESVCADTAYLEDYIRVDTSFVAVPNVFTPDGDGINDNFVVKFWSMQSMNISIFNRWGKRIHFWESSNVRGFEEARAEAVWDGRSGGRYASPGVYYYVIEGRGRDDKTRKKHGFFHLFRGKD
ncbi:MAG: gliding motility-associated C-terminal domain-containing protein, partial [Mariniphaga sp.]